MRGAPPPHMGHTLPMTHRSHYGGASKGRFGAHSAVAGGSFTPSLSASSFFTRHNPHPGRVRHIKGLLDVPICHVSDDGFQPTQRPLMTPERRSIYQMQKMNSSASQHPIYPINSYGVDTYDVFPNKGVPFKKVPFVPRWFEELKDISNRAGLEPSLDHQQTTAPQKASYSKVTGRLNEAPSRAMSRSGPASRAGRGPPSRYGVFTGGINKQPDNEALIMELLCQILQTDSLREIQQWLISAPVNEKEMACELIRVALATDQQVNDSKYSEPYMRDEFLENRKQASAGPVDRLVVESNQEPAEVPEQTKLPDINQPRSASRLSDQIKQTSLGGSGYARFDVMAPVSHNDQEYVEYRSLDAIEEQQE